ncbi:MAG: hypothetical protein IKB78_01095 [Clostridia bacterium]|nr:hypothetical protein [Clostridia bacterium]
MFLMLGIYRALLNSGLSAGVAAAVHSNGQLLLSTTLLTLLHRQFTFRATEKWFIALPIMLIADFGWQFLSSLALSIMTAANRFIPHRTICCAGQSPFRAVDCPQLPPPALRHLLPHHRHQRLVPPFSPDQ